MNQAPITIPEAEAHLAEVEARKTEIEARKTEIANKIGSLEAEQKELIAELFLLSGRYGKIERASAAVAKARRYEEVKNNPRPIWVDEPSGKDWLILKVTPKRIYLITLGLSEQYYLRSTGKVSGDYSFCGILNVAATVAAWESREGKATKGVKRP